MGLSFIELSKVKHTFKNNIYGETVQNGNFNYIAESLSRQDNANPVF